MVRSPPSPVRNGQSRSFWTSSRASSSALMPSNLWAISLPKTPSFASITTCVSPKICHPIRVTSPSPLATGGRHSQRLPYYIHIMPAGSFLAGGMYMPTSVDLQAIHAAIADDPGPIKNVIGAPAFRKYFGEVSGEKLKTAPRGYGLKPSSNRAAAPQTIPGPPSPQP